MSKRYGTNDDLVGFITDETEEDEYNKEQVLRGLLREKNRRGLGATPGGFVIPAAGSGSGSGSGSGQFKVATVSVGPGGVVGGGGGPVAGGGGRPSVPYTPPITPPSVTPPTVAPPPAIVYPGTTDSGYGTTPPVPTGGGYSDSGYSGGGGSLPPDDDAATEAEIQRLKDEVAQEEALQEGPTPTPAGQEQIIVSEDETPKPKVEETNPIKRFFEKLKNLFK